jgi:hypothetical protein
LTAYTWLAASDPLDSALPRTPGQRQEVTAYGLCLWWSGLGSNQRPPACRAGALPLSYATISVNAGQATDGSVPSEDVNEFWVGFIVGGVACGWVGLKVGGRIFFRRLTEAEHKIRLQRAGLD